ncbi:MAG: hypothetical protein Kow0031_15060 [Anaerolineae bacterium]
MESRFKMTRFQQILSVALVVQLALAVWVFWPQAPASAGGPLLPGFEPGQVTALVISDNSDNRLALARQGEGWVLPEADDFPAKGDAVTSLLDKLSRIQATRLVAQTEASYPRLQVADSDFSRKLELTLSDGSTRELYVGSAAGAGAVHVRTAGAPQVYLTNEVSSFDANATAGSWIDTLYFSVPATATTRLTLENSNGTFVFTRGVTDTWELAGLAAGETLDSGEVTRLLNTVQSVRMTEPLGTAQDATFGLDEPLATVTLQTADGDYTLQVGAKNEDDGSYVLKASHSPYIVRVGAIVGDALADKARADFLQAPEEAAE